MVSEIQLFNGMYDSVYKYEEIKFKNYKYKEIIITINGK